MSNKRGHPTKSLSTLATLAVLAACAQQPADDGDGGGNVADEAEPPKTISILRTDIDNTEPEKPLLVALEEVVGFPDGGTELDDAALSTLRAIAGSDQLASGAPIILRAHSDAAGSDSANMRASNQRAETIKDWLVDTGVDPSRVQITAFGEQNPIEPNALPDGSPNEAGRAVNRRVEIEIPALASTVSTPDQPIGEAPSSEASD